MDQHSLPGLAPEMLEALPQNDLPEAPEEFDWWANTDGDLIVESQQAVAVYRNRRGHVVIRGERQVEGDEDGFIHLSTTTALKALIDRLQRELREGF